MPLSFVNFLFQFDKITIKPLWTARRDEIEQREQRRLNDPTMLKFKIECLDFVRRYNQPQQPQHSTPRRSVPCVNLSSVFGSGSLSGIESRRSYSQRCSGSGNARSSGSGNADMMPPNQSLHDLLSLGSLPESSESESSLRGRRSRSAER